jgi:hypothetical protein
MKLNRFAFLILPATALLLTSCAGPGPVADARPRFREAAAANVVLNYAGGGRINVTQPECRENGFMIDFSQNTVGPALDRLNTGRDLAVVVLRWSHEREDINQLLVDWKDLLRSHGYKRIVCLEAGPLKQVQGLVILDDTALTGSPLPRTAKL